MEAPSKSKTWGNEDNVQTGMTSLAQYEAPTLEKEEGPSDVEYEEHLEQPKKRRAGIESQAPQITTQAQGSDEHSLSAPTEPEIQSAAAQEPGPSDAAQKEEKDPLAATDADWLRTRTSRLLGLTDADNDPNPTTAEPDSPHTTVELGPGQSEELEGPEASPDESPIPIETDASLGTVDANVAAIELSGRLFVRNLLYSTGVDELRQLFSSTGQLEEVR